MRSGVPIQRRSGQMPVARLVVRAIAPGSFDAALFGQDILVRTRLLCLNWSPTRSFFEAAKLEYRTSNIEHRTSNIEHRTSNIEHCTLNFKDPEPGFAPENELQKASACCRIESPCICDAVSTDSNTVWSATLPFVALNRLAVK